MQCDGGQESKERAFRKPLHFNALRFHDTAKLVETGHFCRPVDAGCCGSIFPPRTMMWPFARAACHPVVLSSRFFMHRDVYVAQLSALLEQRVDVNAHVVDGTHVWGFFRAAMYFPLVEAFGPDRVPADMAQRLAAAFDTAMRRRGLPMTAVRDNAPVGSMVPPGDGPVVVAASGPSHHRNSHGLHESPVADAWVRLLRADGHAVLKLDLLPSWFTTNQPRRLPGVSLPPVTDLDRHRSAILVKERWVPAIVALFSQIVPILQREVGIDLSSAVSGLIARAVAFVAEREAVGRWLDLVQPRTIAFICYYETCYLSLISAARERGIPTVDLQHGMNGTVHAAYTHWTALPADGYDVLPDWFLTWGEPSSDNLRRWWPAQTRHRALVGGRHDLDPTAPLTDDTQVAALAARARAAARCILVTLQDEPLDPILLAEMRAAPADWVWVLRPHPSSVRIPEASAEAATAQLAAADVRTAVVVPLNVGTLADLMQLADFHITGTSSSWMDAWVYDVPTAFIHPGAGQLFATEIADGLAHFVPNGRGVCALIAGEAPRRLAIAAAVVERSPEVARRALATILSRP
ncbi:MAG: hypothetical protein ACOVRP_10370 [Gemmatimonas sp.]|jgi:hypothetical protein